VDESLGYALIAALDRIEARVDEASRRSPRNERVLLVDDDPDIRDFIELRIFRDRGFHDISTAEDGKTGFALASSLVPDLIVTNVMMPKAHGFEMVRKIRDDAGLTEPCIVFLTAKALETDRELGFEVGADEYLIKPFDPIEAANAIDAALARTADRRAGLAARRHASD
jgi:DNA-binding response OmpR family regulator